MPRTAALIDAVHVAVLDQLDPRAGRADLLDQVVVPRPVEDDRRDVVDHAAERVRDRRARCRRPGSSSEIAPARDRADGHLPHVHVGQRRHRAARRRGDHRDGVRPAARDDGPPLERVEREVVLLPARADRRPGRELLRLLVPADHDLAADRHLLERDARPGERRLLGRLLVGAAEPARAGERRALGHARERLAQALPPYDLGPLVRGLRLGDLGHAGCRARSADCMTSSITSSIVRSTFAFSTTGTPCASRAADDVGLDPADVVELLEVLVHRANPAGRDVPDVEMDAVDVLVGDLDDDVDDQRALDLGRQQARDEVHALEHHRPALGERAVDRRLDPDAARAGTGRGSRRSSGRRSRRRRRASPASKLE